MPEQSPLRVLAWPARRKRVDNPYSYLVQESTAPHGIETTEFGPKPLLASKWDVIHIHWPDMVLLRGGAARQAVTGLLLLLVLRVHRMLGARLVWTVHNVMPHERTAPRVAQWFMTSFSAIVDGVISPSAAGVEMAAEAYPRLAECPTQIVPIGSYAAEYPPAPAKSSARQMLDISEDATVFLAFGMIRAYKNLSHLAECFHSLEDPSAVLVIAGPPNDRNVVASLRTIAAADPRIRILAERIDDKDVPTLFAAADHFVAPFTSIVNSSSLLLALTYNCRAIVPAVGGLPEIAAAVGTGWVTLFDGEFTTEHLAEASTSSDHLSASPDLDGFDWDHLGCLTASLFRQVAVRSSDVERNEVAA